MPTYRVYLLDALGRIRRGEWLEADDDEDALRKAHAFCSDEEPTFEVWQTTRRVGQDACEPRA